MRDLACRLLFGEVEGDAMHERVEQATGGACPCFAGKTCPLVGEDNRSPLMKPGDEAWRRPIPLLPVQRAVRAAC